MNMGLIRVVALAALAGLATTVAAGASSTHGKHTRSGTDWPVYGGQAAQDHYSSLRQINRANVHRLAVAWTFDTGERGGLQTSPLIVGRVLYAYTPTQKVIALDAATGKLLWTFDSGIKGTQPVRGLTYWHDGHERRLLAGVMNFLYALDPANGNPISTFGENGRVDLRKGLRGDFEKQSIALTTPGVIYKDLIIVGGRNPETRPAPPGDIRAFDVRTGLLRWSFHTIPHPGEFGYETWPRDAWTYSGSANNWTGMSVDLARGIVYVPTGSAVFDFYGADRIGADLFANTLLALDAATGKRLWHFQGVHHDIWDRDFPSPPTLLTIKHNGKRVDAVAQTTKQGYIYLFDRVTGQPVFPIEEMPLPPSNVPGEKSWPTQPKPMVPEPFARQVLTEEMLTDRTPESHDFAVRTFRSFRSEGQFVPFSLEKQTVIFPGFDGGAEWGGSAADVRTGVLYVNANEMAWTGGLAENKSSVSAGEMIYQSICGVCHGEKREGAPPAFPSLIGVEKRYSDKQIAAIVAGGKGRMPGFPNVDETAMKALLGYLGHEAPSRPPTEAGQSNKDEMEAASAVTKLTAAISVNIAGRQSYEEHCAVCHGEQLEGIGASFPALRGIGTRMQEKDILERIHKGKGRMPAFHLPDDEVASLLRYLGAGQPQAPAAADPDALKYRFTGYRKFLDPENYPAIKPPWGTLNAIDLNTGKYLWKIPLGEYPELAAQGLKDTGSENYGGPIVTRGGIVFIAATVYDRKIRAYDSRTGRLLWEHKLPLAGVATPATYMVDGRQYVVIAAGGGRDPRFASGGVYVAFALR